MLVDKPNILIALGDGECSCLMKNLQALGNVTPTRTLAETLRLLRSRTFDVLFCAWEVRDGRWSKLMADLRAENLNLPTILYYHCGGESEWTEALGAGAFDLLAPPFDQYKLAVLVEHAMASREREKIA